MGKKRVERGPNFFEGWDPGPPPAQIVAIRYSDGREVTLDSVGDDALLEELREYVGLRESEIERKFLGMGADGLRDLGRELSETARQQVSDRNILNSTRPRKAKDVTRAVLLKYRDDFARRHENKSRGWRTAAQLEFGISGETLAARLKDDDLGG
jgi:hypothetical protein